MEIRIVRAGRKQIGLCLIVNVRDLANSQTVDGVAVECIAIGYQVGGLVVDAAVGVHAAVVARGGVIKRTRHRVRIALRRGIGHVTNDTDGAREVFADQPARGRGIVAGAVAEINELAPDIG